jgi:hypothetical protein
LECITPKPKDFAIKKVARKYKIIKPCFILNEKGILALVLLIRFVHDTPRKYLSYPFNDFLEIPEQAFLAKTLKNRYL